MKKHIITLLVIFISLSGQSQTKKAFLKAADEAMANKNYYGALVWYGEVLEFDEADPSIIYKYAEAARKFEAYDLAAEKYKLLVDSLGEDQYPDASYKLATMYQRMGKYEEAKKYYDLFVSEYGGEEYVDDAEIQNLLRSLNFALENIKNIDKSAEISHVEKEVNTPFSEFGAIKIGDKLYFTTMRYKEKDSPGGIPRPISKLHIMEGDTNQVIQQEINETNLSIAHTAYSSGFKRIYYNVCEYISYEDLRCDIYMRDIDEDGVMGPATKLPSPINIDSVTTTQPSVYYDIEKDRDVLFFASDRQGGKGKLDIYYAYVARDGEISEIKNTGIINTEEDDASPYFHAKTNTLYFSTTGREGMGGFDIYKSKFENNNWSEPEFLKAPVNSSFHDMYYWLDESGKEGYFSSNRYGAVYLDEAKKACCFDIFNVKYNDVVIELNAETFDAFTSAELDGATLYLIDGETGDTLKTITNEDGNRFEFVLKRDKSYKLLATRPYYNPEIIEINTEGISESTVIDKKIYLTTDRMQVDVFTFNKRTKEALYGVEVSIRNLTTGKVDTIAKNEVGNDYHFYLEPGNKYEIVASKFGFVTERVPLDLSTTTKPGLIRKDVYLEVFDIEDYMPLTVYFENDYPDPHSTKTYSSKKYGDLYQAYIRNKSTYIQKKTRKLKGAEKEEALRQLDAFFEGDVAGGYEMLKKFMRSLKKELGLGRSLEIALKGYASPLAEEDYNKALGHRRVWSVRNEILNYEGGIFRNYISQGKLKLIDISYGEENAPKDVSDSPKDVTKSIYSVRAAKERRVEIVRISDF